MACWLFNLFNKIELTKQQGSDIVRPKSAENWLTFDFGKVFLDENRFLLKDEADDIYNDRKLFVLKPDKHLKTRTEKLTSNQVEHSHYWYLTYQFDFLDMQEEAMILTKKIQMIRNLPHTNRERDSLVYSYKEYTGTTLTGIERSETRSLHSLLLSFQNRRSVIWQLMWKTLKELHIWWHRFNDHLGRFQKMSSPPVRRFEPYPYIIKPVTNVFDVPTPLKNKIATFRSQGRFRGSETIDKLFDKQKDKSNKTGQRDAKTKATTSSAQIPVVDLTQSSQEQ